MPAVEMLCLANSWKHGGRCVAGILDDGSWIRPVSAAGDGGLEASACRLDSGRAVDALDVVEIALAEPSPLPHQPENWTVADETWKLVGKQYLPYVRERLERRLYDEPSILGSVGPSVAWRYAQNRDHSLALIKARRPRFRRGRDPTQFRVEFDYRGNTYDLPITFELLPTLGRSLSDWYLTVSLGEPYGSACYKLVAGAIPVP